MSLPDTSARALFRLALLLLPVMHALPAWAACDALGTCCAGKDVYFCTADGGPDVSQAPFSTCSATGCAAMPGMGMTGCQSSGATDTANTVFCNNHCLAGCTGPDCPGTCVAGSLCVNGVCQPYRRGVVHDWRQAAFGYTNAVNPPDSGIRAMCSTYTWSAAIQTNGTLKYWGTEPSNVTLFASPDNNAVTDARQVACSDGHVLVLRADGTLTNIGATDSYMPAGLSGIKSIAATQRGRAAVRQDGSIIVWGVPDAIGFIYSGDPSYQKVLDANQGTAGYVSVTGGYLSDAGFFAIKSDGTAVIAGRRLDNHGWPATPPAQVSGVIAGAISLQYASALKSDGSVVVWDFGGNILANPPGLKPCVAVAIVDLVPIALQVDGTVAIWTNAGTTGSAAAKAIIAALAPLKNVVFLDQMGTGALTDDGSCGAVSDLGCCNGDQRYWCDANGTLQTEACATGSCGWQTKVSHFCDTHCNGGGNGCFCDAACTNYGDCCNADGSGKAGPTCAGSTCGSCAGTSSPIVPNEYQCNSAGGSAPGGGQVPLRACICIPSCAGKQCGSDGCGGSCDKGSCDDGNACTQNDKCAGESCAGTPVNCDDGNPCTTDACVVQNGAATCQNTNSSDPCSDGNACTVGDTCAGGTCVPGTGTLACDDANVCTDDSCAPATGCVFAANTAACSDGNACTSGDVCAGTVCAGPLATDCDDGNVCTNDGCDPASGCTHAPNAATCDDQSNCTTNDTCTNGKCVGTGVLSCDDGNPCTTDDCLDATTCAPKVNIADGTKCNDGSACHLAGTCQAGACTGMQNIDCDDKNPCTDDSCDAAKGCTHANNTAPCSDGNACTSGDTCAGGACNPGGPLASCDDKNPCTDDCDPSVGCVKKPNTLPCDDGSVCTLTDTCSGGSCVGTGAKSCDDGNPCTFDNCNALLGCQHSFKSVACDDGNQCTSGDYCWQGSCTGGSAPSCDDGNNCTTDACNPVSGCVHVKNSAPCDDKNACTLGDMCVAGICTPGKAAVCNDNNPCTTDSCNATLGCVFTQNQLACDDGNACTVTDTCAGGACKGVAKACADSNVCTDDGCDAKGNCTHTNNTAACDDGNPCTVSDVCSYGTCAGGAKCDDGNPCTVDTCAPTTQYTTVSGVKTPSGVAGVCSHVASAGATCSDGDPCTTADACAADGKCVGAALCVGGTCTAAGGVATCKCATAQKLVTQGQYQTCCTPSCTGKKCGDDGCGGSCGSCGADENCSADGASCQPKIACYGNAPTDHGCCDGRVLRHCGAPNSLSSIDCAASGQYCGWSATLQDYACTNTGLSAPSGGPAFKCPKAAACDPVANCKGRSCGPDGCGGQCPNTCKANETCSPLDGKCIATECGGGVPPGGCIENITTNVPTVGNSILKTTEVYYGCGCPSGKYDASGNCTFTPLTGQYAGFPVVGTNCVIRGCQKNADGTSSIQNVQDTTCARGVYWDQVAGKWLCYTGQSQTTNNMLLVLSDAYKMSWGKSKTELATDTGPPHNWPMTVQACGSLPLAGKCQFPTVRVCGPDGSGGSCGSCPTGQSCKADGSACYTPQCNGRECGPDNGGNSCGTCASGKSCNAIGKCVTCASATAEQCTSGTATYCGDTNGHTFDCTAKGGTCGPQSLQSGTVTCFAAPVGKCDASCKASNSSCSCDPSCVAAGTCCSNFDAMCAKPALLAKCGNGTCEAAGGENNLTCASDCPAGQVCTNASVLAAPYPERIDGAGTPQAKATLVTTPPFDVRPAPPPIPQQGLAVFAPQLGTQAGSPHGYLNLQTAPEPGTTTAVTVGSTTGIDGDGFLIDGQTDTAGNLQRAMATVALDGTLRSPASVVRGEGGGFTVAAWVKVPSAASPAPNVLGSAQDLGYGDWTEALGLCGIGTFSTALCTKNGARPGLQEHCFTSRPDDARVALSCGKDTIVDVEAYWGDAATDFLPNDDCTAWRQVPRTAACADSGITDRLRAACVGQKTCNPPPEAIGSNPCTGVAGTNGRLLVRALCGDAPAGATLYVEGKDGSQTCPSDGCPPEAPNNRLVLQLPNAIQKSGAYAWGTASHYKPLVLRSGAQVPMNTWFHVAITFQPGALGSDDHSRMEGRYALFVNGGEVGSGYGWADATTGWHWGRGYLDGVTANWPNVWGTKLSPAHAGDTPFNAVSNAAFDDFFAYRRALTPAEIKLLADRPTSGALRVWPSVSSAEVAASNLWTTGGQVSAIPLELPWLRDPGTCNTSSASGLVRATFDGLHVASGATLAMPADGGDLDGLSTWTFSAWLRVPTLTVGQKLLEVRQGAASRLALASSSTCSGRGLKVTFPDGTSLESTNCDHVLAAGEWMHIAVAQYEGSQRAFFIDGAPVTGSGSSTLFDSALSGKRQVVVTNAADLGFATLLRDGQLRSGVAGLRTSGPAMWASGGLQNVGGKVTPIDFANFHNNSATGPVDQPAAFDAQGVAVKSVQNGWAWLKLPLRGRLAPDTAQIPPPLTVAGTLTIPTGATLDADVARLGIQGGATWQTQLHCATSVTTSGWSFIPHATRSCTFRFRHVSPTGTVTAFESAPVSVSTGTFVTTVFTPVDLDYALAFADDVPAVAGVSMSAGTTVSSQFTQPGGGESALYLFGGGVDTLHARNLRVWYGAALPDNLRAAVSAACDASGMASTCDAQSRTCTDVSSGATGLHFGSCGACKSGLVDIAGECLPLRQPMSLCARDDQCSTQHCIQGICQWALTDAAACTATCRAKGLACTDKDPAVTNPTGYACSTSQCADDFAWDGSTTLTSQDGYDHLPVCTWTPSRQAGAICERDTQCLGGGICATVAEDGYNLDKSAAKTAMGKGNLDSGGVGPDWSCTPGVATCVTSKDTTASHKRCIAPTQAFCTALHRSPVAASGTRWDGEAETGVTCGQCLPDTIDVGGQQKPVYRKLWSEYASTFCAKAVNTYYNTYDFLPLLGAGYDTDTKCQAWFKTYRSMAGIATVTRRDGSTIKAPATSDLVGKTLNFADTINAVKNGKIVGFVGHELGGLYAIDGLSAGAASALSQATALPQPGMMVNHDEFVYQCVDTATYVWLRQDLMTQTLDLPAVSLLLGLTGMPATTSGLTTAQLTALKDAGVGAELLHILKWNETHTDKLSLVLDDCPVDAYKRYGTAMGTQAAHSQAYDPSANFTLCEYNRFPNGTQCPYAATDDVTAADAFCDSAFCAYDTGVCEPGVQEVDENTGKTTNRQSDPLSDDIGYFAFSGMNYSTLRFGKYPYAPILHSLGLPTPTNPDDDIDTPADGGVKDNRHLQVRGQLKATVTIPMFHSNFYTDVGLPAPSDTGDPAGSYEMPWNLVDIDLGYTVVPGHKVVPKKLRYAPKLELFGISIVSPNLKPISGDACTAGSAKVCGLAKDGHEAVLECLASGVWLATKCSDTSVCSSTGGTPICVQPAATVGYDCGQIVKNGEYNPPPAGSPACTPQRKQLSLESGAEQKALVPTATGIQLLDLKFPTLGGECSDALKLKAGAKPMWTQGLGVGQGISSFQTCLAETTGPKKIKCLANLMDAFSDAPGVPPTEFCVKQSPVLIGPLPMTFEANAAPVLRLKVGMDIDSTTFEPAVQVRPSLGLEVSAVAKFDLQEVVDSQELMALIKQKLPIAATIFNAVASKISAQAGLSGELAVIEVGFPMTWSLGMTQLNRTAPSRGLKKGSLTLADNQAIENLWSLAENFDVDLDMVLLKLELKLFFKLGLKFLLLNPQLEKEVSLFSFSGFDFNWKLKHTPLQQWKVDFDWPGPQLIQ